MNVSLMLVVPSLARWCAVHRLDEAGRPVLALVWHADEDLHDRLEKAVTNSTMSAKSECFWVGRPRLETAAELRAEAALLERGGS